MGLEEKKKQVTIGRKGSKHRKIEEKLHDADTGRRWGRRELIIE